MNHFEPIFYSQYNSDLSFDVYEYSKKTELEGRKYSAEETMPIGTKVKLYIHSNSSKDLLAEISIPNGIKEKQKWIPCNGKNTVKFKICAPISLKDIKIEVLNVRDDHQTNAESTEEVKDIRKEKPIFTPASELETKSSPSFVLGLKLHDLTTRLDVPSGSFVVAGNQIALMAQNILQKPDEISVPNENCVKIMARFDVNHDIIKLGQTKPMLLRPQSSAILGEFIPVVDHESITITCLAMPILKTNELPVYQTGLFVSVVNPSYAPPVMQATASNIDPDNTIVDPDNSAVDSPNEVDEQNFDEVEKEDSKY